MNKGFSFLIISSLLLAGCFHKKEQLTISYDRVDGLVEGSPVSSYMAIEFSNARDFLTSSDTLIGEYHKQAFMDDIMSDTTKRKNIEKSLDKIAIGIGELGEKC